jgi:hypothetical protein
MRVLLLMIAGTCALTAGQASAQGTAFDIHWRTIAVAESTAPGAKAQLRRTGARLDKADASGIAVDRVEVEPAVLSAQVGQTVCLGQFDYAAFFNDQRVPGLKLMLDVRADHLPQLQMSAPAGDVCFKPSAPGEYPVRITSLTPARDSTLRGAQIYLRVSKAREP